MDVVQPTPLSDYRLTIPQKRGILMKPLVFRPDPPPILGESLLGLLARTASRNGFTGLRKVLSRRHRNWHAGEPAKCSPGRGGTRRISP